MHESFNTAIDTNWAIFGGILFVSGAINVEWLGENMDEDSLTYVFATAVEEGMEMFDVWLFLVVNLYEMKQEAQIEIGVSIR